jgi:hypothetical protein
VYFLTEEEGMFQYFDTPKGLEVLVIHFLEWWVWENNNSTEEVGKVILKEGLVLEEETNVSIISEKDRNCPTSAVLLIKENNNIFKRKRKKKRKETIGRF